MEVYILIWVDPYGTPEHCSIGCGLERKEIKGVFTSMTKLNDYIKEICDHYGYYDMKDFVTEPIEMDKTPFLYLEDMYDHIIIAAALKGPVYDYEYHAGPWDEDYGTPNWFDDGFMGKHLGIVYKIGDIIQFPTGRYCVVRKDNGCNYLIKLWRTQIARRCRRSTSVWQMFIKQSP